MSTKPLFLLSNDDGVYAPGLRALAKELREIADVIVVAPTEEKSATSQSITITKPIRLHELEEQVYAVEGTPADCVMLAMQNLLQRRPDWVVSGINHGGNLGTDILYSGTVGAALEGALNGCRAMAVSLEGVERTPHYYESAAKVARHLLVNQEKINCQEMEVVNVNIPNIEPSLLKGIRAARVGKRIYESKMWEREDPRGKPYYWIGGSNFGHEKIPETDLVILNEGYVTLSKLHADYYNHESTERLSQSGVEGEVWESLQKDLYGQ